MSCQFLQILVFRMNLRGNFGYNGFLFRYISIPLPSMTDPDKCNIFHMHFYSGFMWFSMLFYNSSCSNSLHVKRNLFHLSNHYAIASSLSLGKAVFSRSVFQYQRCNEKLTKKKIDCVRLPLVNGSPHFQRGCFELFLLSLFSLSRVSIYCITWDYIFRHQFNNSNLQWVDLKNILVLFHFLDF